MLRGVLFGGLAAVLLAGCDHTSGLWGDTEFDNYSQRLDKVTDSAGDANARNIAIQTNNPNPRYAYDHNIPVSAARMSRAIECQEGTRPANRTITTKGAGFDRGGEPGAFSTSRQTTDC